MGLFSKKSSESGSITVAAAPATPPSIKEVTETIRGADNLNDLLIGTASKAKETINADRVTIYVVDSMDNIIISRVKDGNEVKAISIPINNNSIAGYAAKNIKVVNIKDAYDNSEIQQNHTGLHFDRSWDQLTGYRTKQVICIPVILKGKIQGAIQAINKKGATDDGFSSNDVQTLQRIADSLAPDLYKIKSFEDSQREIEYQKKIKRITDKIHSAGNFDDILPSISNDLEKLFEIDHITIYMLDKTTNELIAKSHVQENIEEIRVGFDNNSIAGFAAKNNKMLKIDDVYNDSELIKISPEIRFDKRWDEKLHTRTKNILAFPLIFGGEVNGVIELINKKNNLLLTDKDIEGAREIATTMGIAMSRQKRIVGKRSKYDAIVSANLISQEKLDEALKKAKDNNDSPEHVLIGEYHVSPAEIGKCYSYYFRTEFIPFTPEMQIPVELIQDITLETLKNELWVPLFKLGDTITVVMEDPKDIVKRDNIQYKFKSANIKFCVSTKDDIIKIIDHFYGVSKTDTPVTENVEHILDELKEEIDKQAKEDATKEELKEDDSAIVRLVNQIIEQGYARRASDIHIEPYTDGDTVVRLRIDGSCQELMKIPKHYKNAIVSRLKIMSNLDISDRRLPQDGKIKFKNFGKLDIELRIATIPTVGGNEDVVMRILASSKPIPLEKLGMNPKIFERFKVILEKPYGICLVVGPTGSGKTTTLHSALGYINTPDMKIWTAEDPVEITQYQLRQVQTHAKIGFTFEKAMKAFLRGDPDVIMVGEMRDLETTSTGLEASLTGHLVFSTLHTNNAPETITRLLEMGIDPFSFADALLGILAQRLLRTLCPKCKDEYHPSKEEFDILRTEYGNNALFDADFKYSNDLMLFRPKEDGCQNCNNRGYRGRMGIYELLVSSDAIKSMIHKKPTPSELGEVAIKEGMITLKQDGIEKVIKGFTTLKEVMSVCIK